MAPAPYGLMHFDSFQMMRSVARIGASIAIALLSAWLIEAGFNGFYYKVPFGTSDLILRLISCLIGSILAHSIWSGSQYSIVAALGAFFAYLDASRIGSFVVIDFDPFPDHLPLWWARVVWFIEFFVATITGAFVGRYFGNRLRKRKL